MKNIAATLLCAAAPAALLAQQVDLRSPDEFISVEGEIIGFNGVMLRVETTVGAVSVPASEVICYGPGCLEILATNDFGLTVLIWQGQEWLPRRCRALRKMATMLSVTLRMELARLIS